MMQLKATGLKDETVLEEFYKSVAETYHFGESYYVVMIHCNYDVPGRGSDNLDMDDASEEVYEFILCCICPVKLSEAGLCYNTQTNRVEERMRDQWIEAPVNAFLFTAFCIIQKRQRSFTRTLSMIVSVVRHLCPLRRRRLYFRRS